MKRVYITAQRDYKPGDLPPEGYLAWHEWAEVQRKAGIKQVLCAKCCLWKTPQELSGQFVESKGTDRYGQVHMMKDPVCTKCASAQIGSEMK